MRRLLYGTVCVAALAYVAYANAMGFVPFAANARSASHGAPTAGFFHK
jgi:hypothetical protein